MNHWAMFSSTYVSFDAIVFFFCKYNFLLFMVFAVIYFFLLFFLVFVLSVDGVFVKTDLFTLLSRFSHPFFFGCFYLVLLSFSGLPPFSTFFFKVLLLKELFTTTGVAGWLFLVVFFLFNFWSFYFYVISVKYSFSFYCSFYKHKYNHAHYALNPKYSLKLINLVVVLLLLNAFFFAWVLDLCVYLNFLVLFF